jgi:hypothetical protein
VKLYGMKITIYDYVSGRKCDELDLTTVTKGDEIRYTSMVTSSENGTIFLDSKRKVLEDFEYDFLLLSAAPLTVLYRVQVIIKLNCEEMYLNLI